MNFIKKLFGQRKAYLYDGTEVREGDTLSFMDSDGVERAGKVKRRGDGSLYFWNDTFKISDYANAKKQTF